MKKFPYLFAIVLTLLTGCGKGRFEIDVSQIDLDVSIRRFDQALYSLDSTNLSEGVQEVQKQFPKYFPFYTGHVINIGKPEEASFSPNFKAFLSYPAVIQAQNLTSDIYPNGKLAWEQELEDGFKRYHHFFPDHQVPTIYTHFSGFMNSIVVTEMMMGISLDRYLGRNQKIYRMLGVHGYQAINMVSHKIPSDAMFSWLETEFPFRGKKDNLLNRMIHQGKLIYLTSVMLPDMQDSLLLGLPHKKMEWCRENETAVWHSMISWKHLFSSDRTVMAKYLSPGPFTSYFTKESAGGIGNFTGYRIVSQYMDRNKDVGLKELIEDRDGQKILELSGYAPQDKR